MAGERPGPYAVLAARARRSSDEALAAAAAVGLMAVAGLWVARPAWWVLALPLVALGAFGAWGMAEREQRERRALAEGGPGRALVVVQWLAVAVGTGAALLTAFGVLAALFGRVIS
jgi:hypothetical protein